MGVLSIGGKVKFEGSKFILMDSLVQFNNTKLVYRGQIQVRRCRTHSNGEFSLTTPNSL